MSNFENKDQGKGFKGLQSLGSKLSESAELPACEVDAPALPPAWEEGKTQEAAIRTQPIQSQTAAPPWRGWLIGLGSLGAIVLLIAWASNLSSSRSSYSTSSADYSSTVSVSPPVEVPTVPSITIPQVGSGLVLTSDQIRYCVYENRRMKGAESVVNEFDQTSVGTFNAMVDDYNSRCGSFRYRQGDLMPIEREANQIQAQLEQEGRERMNSDTAAEAAADAAGNAAAAAAEAAAAAAAEATAAAAAST